VNLDLRKQGLCFTATFHMFPAHRVPDLDGSFGMLLQHARCIAITLMNSPGPNWSRSRGLHVLTVPSPAQCCQAGSSLRTLVASAPWPWRGLLWRCLGGSHTAEPGFRWKNRQREHQMRGWRDKAALLMQMSLVVMRNVREGNTGAPIADRDAALFLIN